VTSVESEGYAFRAVLQDLVDSAHHPRVDPVDQLDRLQVLLYLLDGRGSDDGGTDVRVLERPRKRELTSRRSQFLGDRFESSDPLKHVSAPFDLFFEPGTFFGSSGLGRDALVVLAREDPSAQGRKDGQAEIALAVEWRVFDFDPVPRNHVVLGLLDDRTDEVYAGRVERPRGKKKRLGECQAGSLNLSATRQASMISSEDHSLVPQYKV